MGRLQARMVLGAVMVVQTERSQRISSGIDDKLQSFWLYCEDRDKNLVIDTLFGILIPTSK